VNAGIPLSPLQSHSDLRTEPVVPRVDGAQIAEKPRFDQRLRLTTTNTRCVEILRSLLLYQVSSPRLTQALYSRTSMLPVQTSALA